jgi:predicted AlkP superfamily phosphohydrolase/phosphomutase
MEEMQYQHDWFARATGYLLDKYDWDLFFMQTHAGDYMFDHLGEYADPLTSPDIEESEKCIELIGRTYEQVDKMIGRILDHVPLEETLVTVVSDHGVIGYHSHISVNTIIRDILVKNNMLFYKDEKGRPMESGSKPEQGKDQVDWSRTKAQVHDSIYINLNVKDREPNGVVDPGEYEKTRDKIIDALLNYKDPKLGVCPFSLVLRSEDARIIGLYGNRIGDIIFTLREGGISAGGHGVQLPTTKYGMSSLRALFVMAGPGLKRDYKLKRTVWLTDIAPTIAYLNDIPPPRQAEGAILYEVLEEI